MGERIARVPTIFPTPCRRGLVRFPCNGTPSLGGIPEDRSLSVNAPLRKQCLEALNPSMGSLRPSGALSPFQCLQRLRQRLPPIHHERLTRDKACLFRG